MSKTVRCRQLWEVLYKRIHNVRLRKAILAMVRKKEGEFFSETLRSIFKKYHNIEVGTGSYGACFDFERTQPGVRIGKYCSLAKNVYLYTRTHPLNTISTHPAFFNSAVGICHKDRLGFGNLTIGNDVWIGQNAVVLPSCKKIGNGAVVGANAVVTKDVPDYAVVAGVPARIIKYRFSEAEIQHLNDTAWWDMDYSFIAQNVQNFDSFDSFYAVLLKYNEKQEVL